MNEGSERQTKKYDSGHQTEGVALNIELKGTTTLTTKRRMNNGSKRQMKNDMMTLNVKLEPWL